MRIQTKITLCILTLVALAILSIEPWKWVVFHAFSGSDVKAVEEPIHSVALGVAFAFAGLLMILVFRIFIVKPVNTLMEVAASIARGEIVHRIPVHTRDELGALSRSMERMSEAIAAYRKKQESWNRKLEQGVAARTLDFKRSNEALIREIEERENTRISLTASEERYRLLFNTMMHGFAVHEILCDEQGAALDYRFLEVNAAFEAHTGLKREAVVGKRILEVLPEVESEWIARMGKVALQGTSVRFEHYSSPLGKYFDVMAYAPKPGQFATVFSDITERVRLEARLRQAQKMESIGALAGGIAHDFNNILFPIIGYAEMSMDEIPEGDIFLRENLSQILLGAERAKNLVQQILTFSRQGEDEVKPIRLEPIIEESLQLLRANLPATIEIIRETREPSGEIMGDPTQIHQVMMNLCTNAFHAMAENGGVLTLGVEAFTVPRETGSTGYPIGPGRYVKLSIRDTGHGIDSGNIDRIFDPYFTTKAQGKGTGLGLSVVHGIVKNYGGEITVASQPGAGALFEIFFPAVEPTGEDETFPFHRPSPTGTEHILLVDDDGPIAGIMRKMLERLGYRVTACLGSPAALDIFTHHPDRFDLVITDLIMPKMTGVELAERILGIRPEKPIILCTGFSDIITEEDARKTGIREYIPKPVIRKDLARAVRRALDHESPN